MKEIREILIRNDFYNLESAYKKFNAHVDDCSDLLDEEICHPYTYLISESLDKLNEIVYHINYDHKPSKYKSFNVLMNIMHDFLYKDNESHLYTVIDNKTKKEVVL